MRPLLGTFIEIGIIPNQPSDQKAITGAFSVIEQIHKLLSFQDPDSELSRLNRAGSEGLELHPVSLAVLKLALMMTKVSNGDFNCTVGGALVQQGVLPDHNDDFPLTSGGPEDVAFAGFRARLLKPIKITLDGIAKGYAVDQAVNALKGHGIHSGWINAGGDMRVFGDISRPVYRRELNNSTTFLGEFSNIALATSTTQEHFDERFPGVIIDSKEQKQISGIWTVKAGLSWLADSLTKVAGVSSAKEVNAKISALGGTLVVSSPP